MICASLKWASCRAAMVHIALTLPSSGGTYRVVVYAEDNQNFQAQPVATEVNVNSGQQVFLPLVVR